MSAIPPPRLYIFGTPVTLADESPLHMRHHLQKYLLTPAALGRSSCGLASDAGRPRRCVYYTRLSLLENLPGIGKRLVGKLGIIKSFI